MAEKYQRVERKVQEKAPEKNEIRITYLGKIKSYITYALGLLTREQDPLRTIVFKAMGRAINKTVSAAEIIKRRVLGLHQITELGSSDLEEVYEPLEEGLKTVKVLRHVSTISITLSKDTLDSKHYGYQPPLAESEVQAERRTERSSVFDDRRGGRRGRYRGRGRYPRNSRMFASDQTQTQTQQPSTSTTTSTATSSSSSTAPSTIMNEETSTFTRGRGGRGSSYRGAFRGSSYRGRGGRGGRGSSYRGGRGGRRNFTNTTTVVETAPNMTTIQLQQASN
eukprot:TRINITY_DN5967_c0_g1_i1.p1 TRINITY_DN5967_c0_g1~~TRINITY_DN5967_c0_g1_i1.p1  ORF type:complete len:307 (-),score=57.70 TRINITY_DN5967_c0_g1_i1:212-1051(-)